LTELEAGAVAELDFAVTELELALPVTELELGFGAAALELGFCTEELEVVFPTAELARDSPAALETGSTLVPELESGVTCGAVGVVLLSHAFQKNAVIASKIFFQCLYIKPPPYERYSSPLI
jgi:hypothetical protein